MSLIITRNNGTDRPESYHNYLKNTFEVEPHSEIAVHTVVINRDPTYVISDANSQFYIYHGSYTPTELNTLGFEDKSGNSLWVDQPIEVKLSVGRYGVNAFAAHVQAQLNLYDHHPTFQGKWTCTVLRDSNNQFTGFRINAEQRGLDANSKPSKHEVLEGLSDGLTVNMVPAKITFTSSSNTLRGNTILHPLNAAGGEVVWDMNSVTGQWKLGLRRLKFNTAYTVPDNDKLMYDFLLEQVGGSLKVFQFLHDGLMDMEAVEHDYTDEHSSGPFNAEYDWTTNSETFRFIKFKLENQRVTISLAPATGAGAPDTYVMLTNTSKAVGYSNYALFPFVVLQKSGSVVTLESMNLVPGYETTQLDVINLATNNMFSRSDDMSRFENGTDPTQVNGLTRKLITGTRINSETVLVVDSNHASSELYELPHLALPDVGRLLGFEADDVVTPTKPITLVERFDSDVVPSIISDEVLHVRVSALNVRSYNGVQSGISKILYTLPRFSDGKSSGRLHITPPEKTYLKLNNSNKLHMNDIHVEFVNSDETLAQDLVGESYVVFHIKHGGHHRCNCK